MNVEHLINNVKKYNQNIEDLVMIRKAYNYAEKLHDGQKRKSDEEYIIHPLAVAIILSEIKADTDTIIAALLHDTLEDTKVTYEDLVREFNPHVAMLVDGVSKLNKINFSSTDEKNAANTRKLLNGIAEDVRIILIKLADRLHNMSTLEFMTPEKQRENALETLEIFVPLANNLGWYEMKRKLEDLCFKYIDPESYYLFNKTVQKLKADVQDDLYLMLNNINNKLNDQGIPNEIKIRIKNIYGIYKKNSQSGQINEIHDLFALKITVNEMLDCYKALGIIHDSYHPFQGSFKDYIAVPKANLYQSLHTTVFGEREHLVQMQIRTFEMAKIAEFGLPSFWQDENVIMNDELRTKRWFKSLVEVDQSASSDIEYFQDIREEIFRPNIYCYTPKGGIIELPTESTPIDFAYKIHTNLGNDMVAAIVNGNYVVPSFTLKNQDIVKIITEDDSPGPKREWIEDCKTPLAKKKILAFHDKN